MSMLQKLRPQASKPLPTQVNIREPHTAFGEVQVAELTPIIQLQFPYSVNPRFVTNITKGSGGATVSASLLTVSTGTTTASYSLLKSKRLVHYHPGEGILARWTSVFPSAGTSGTENIHGIGNEEDGFFFGYDGTSFGILHRKEGKLEHRTLTFTTGAVTASGTITITLDGVATTVEVVQNDSVQAVARAVDAITFVGWETQAIGDAVIFTAHLAETRSGTYSFADTDTTGVAATGGLVQSITGVAPTDTWTKQADWNEDTMDGSGPSGMTLRHDFGNVYEVQYQWLGFGEIIFSIEDPKQGRRVDVHHNEFANSSATPSIQNPSLPLFIGVKNKATTTDITVKSSSMAAFLEGRLFEGGVVNSAFGTKDGATVTTETSILALKSRPIFQSVENRVDWLPILLSFSFTGSGAVKLMTLRAYLNPILGGDPVFTDVDTAESIITVDTAGTAISGGNKIAQFTFTNKVDGFGIPLAEFTQSIPPESLVVFTIQTDAGTTDAGLGLSWRELF